VYTIACEGDVGGKKVKTRKPAWCDRILLHSLPDLQSQVRLISYDAIAEGPVTTVSDHLPVVACFEIEAMTNVPSAADGVQPATVLLRMVAFEERSPPGAGGAVVVSEAIVLLPLPSEDPYAPFQCTRQFLEDLSGGPCPAGLGGVDCSHLNTHRVTWEHLTAVTASRLQIRCRLAWLPNEHALIQLRGVRNEVVGQAVISLRAAATRTLPVGEAGRQTEHIHSGEFASREPMPYVFVRFDSAVTRQGVLCGRLTGEIAIQLA
jgi:hypothetical protein